MFALAVIVLRWVARITGLLLVGMVVLFVVGEGPPNIFRQPPSVTVEFAGTGLMLAGFLAGWRWEAIGGITAVAGFAVFIATELIVNRHLPGGAIWLFVVPGLLLLASSGLRICLPMNR
jgi:hypothetical protein